MEEYAVMVQVACVIIISGFCGIVVSAAIDIVARLIAKHRKKKKDAGNKRDTRQ